MSYIRFASSQGSDQHRLIFRWPERSASFVLPLLFLLSVAVHALTFYVFQVVYPPIVSIAPPPAHVTLLTPSSPQNEALLRWVDSQDPTAAANLQDVAPPGLGEVQYKPSYATAHTLPETGESWQGSTDFPPARDPVALTEPVSRHPDVPRAAVHSSVVFSESLRDRDEVQDQIFALASKSTTSLLPSKFLVAIGAQGDLRYCFLQESCGDRTIDEQAEALLRERDFKEDEKGAALTWGFATFVWGAEAFAPAPPHSADNLEKGIAPTFE